MGRSVMTIPDATATAYDTFEPDEEHYRAVFDDQVAEGFIDEDKDFESWMYAQWGYDAADEYEALLEWIMTSAVEHWPSFTDAIADNEWLHEECRVVAKNAHSLIAVSEYCGVVAISLAPNYDRGTYWRDSGSTFNIGEHWRQQIAARFEKTFGTMHKLGGLSDGTSVYMREAS